MKIKQRLYIRTINLELSIVALCTLLLLLPCFGRVNHKQMHVLDELKAFVYGKKFSGKGFRNSREPFT